MPADSAWRPTRRSRFGLDRPAGAFAWYVAISLIYTWPLAKALGSHIASDLGDPLLNSWILAWNAERFLDLLTGDLAGFSRIWHANILYPEPYVLAYSELLHAQGVQALPIWALTENPVLTYNVVFLSTYALSGLGMFLFVRELTGNTRAAFAAGLLYAFLPYRADQAPHLQTLSSQWMPFALYGLRRYFETRRAVPLAGAVLALTAQNLSCGYFLYFFSLLVPPYVLWEMWTRGLLGNGRIWRDMSLAAAGVALLTIPAMYPYLALRELRGLRRNEVEVLYYSADLLGYLTAPDVIAAWNWLQLAKKAEGHIFLGIAGPLVAATGVIFAAWRVVQTVTWPEAGRRIERRWERALLMLALVLAVLSGFALLAYFIVGPIDAVVWEHKVRMRSPVRAGVVFLVSMAVLLGYGRRLMPSLRATAAGLGRSPAVAFGVLTITAATLAFGPDIQVNGTIRATGHLYSWLYANLPGFDGLRVPARAAMVAGCLLAVGAGLGAAVLLQRAAFRKWLFPVLVAALLADGWLVHPFPTVVDPPGDELVLGDLDLFDPVPQVFTGSRTPGVYRAAARLQAGSVLVEFPFGQRTWDYHATFYASAHWHPVMNGMSGFIPADYERNVSALSWPAKQPDEAWRILTRNGVSHVILHRRAYPPDEVDRILEWLNRQGARRLWTDGRDDLFELPRRGAANPR